MGNEEPNYIAQLVMILCIGFVGFMMYMLGYAQGEHKIYLEAVKHDAAHWIAESDGTAHIEWGKK